MSKKEKGVFRTNLEYFATLAGFKIIRMIPLRIAIFLAKLIFRIYFYTDSRRRKRTIQHILHAGIETDHSAAVRLAKINFGNYAQTAVEIVKMDQILTPKNLKEKVSYSGDKESIEKFLTGEKTSPAIIVTSHTGNWELAGITYTMTSRIPLLSVMRPMANVKLERFFYKRVNNHNHNSCLKKGAIKSLLSALKKGESIAIVTDQHASSSEGIETSFFGHPARTHVSPAILHLKTGIPIIVVALLRTKTPGYFTFNIKEAINEKPSGDKEADVKKVTQMYTDKIEEIIREYPEQWPWTHRRWLDINRKSKYTAPDAE
ncbi:MAG: hypothetical protein A2020_10260 [Lentisphaerae bacterium GWF2_45_14]|nr:MAG: hypothetical protein A2020_10260 [Lentisphaerae bacterium GWF2_45_14]